MWSRMGFKTLVIYIIKGVLPGLFLMILSFFLVWIKDYLVSGANSQIIQLGNSSQLILAIAGVFMLISFPVIALGVIINVWRYFSVQYKLEEDVLKFNRGVISVDEVSIPYQKIEDVDLDQSVFGRIIGVASVSVITAGREEKGADSETEAIFHMMDIGKARSLQSELLSRGSVQKVKSV
jgi:uncharacterized membrane protein YdbT with pleckstrin-like domain